MALQFKSFDLNSNVVNNFESLGYLEATEVQEKVIPLALKGKSMVVKSPTGSGKTHAFLIPIINSLCDNENLEAVILVPSKELGQQTFEFLDRYQKIDANVTSKKVLSTEDLKNFNKTAKILITTPELFLRLVREKGLNSKYVKTLVLDEADMLIFGGFIEAIGDVFNNLGAIQVLVFTASIDNNLKTFLKKFVKAPLILDLGKDEFTSNNVTHYGVDIKHIDKLQALQKFLLIVKPYKTIIFSSTKEYLIKVYNYLSNQNIKVTMVHGDLSKRERKNALKRFENDEIHIILGTDVLARGIDIPGVTDVISLDLPKEINYYFHRAGRTGRNGKKGNSYVFYNSDDTKKISEVMKKGTNFKFYSLKDDSLKEENGLNEVSRTKKSSNVFLEKEIKKEIAKYKNQKIKPMYKKKIKIAIKKVRDEHKKKIIRTNIREKNKGNNI